MKVTMIGSPTCIKCKKLHPLVEEHCSSHNIEFSYLDASNLPKNIMDMLISHDIKLLPAFFIEEEKITLFDVNDDRVNDLIS